MDVDPYAVPRALHAAFEHLGHAELLADSLVVSLVSRNCSTDVRAMTLSALTFGELREDVVVDAVDEESVLLHVAAVLERQDRDEGRASVVPRRAPAEQRLRWRLVLPAAPVRW